MRDLALELGTPLPFASAARLFHKATVSAATVRRWTETVGALAVTLADEENADVRTHLPAPPVTTTPVVMEADGAMVPLLGGQWAQVKLLVIGRPAPTTESAGHLSDLSCVARLADAETFIVATASRAAAGCRSAPPSPPRTTPTRLPPVSHPWRRYGTHLSAKS